MEDLWRISADGSGTTFFGFGGGADWSPDGGLIVYSESGEGSTRQLYVTDPAKTSVRQLTTDGFNTAPSWSPDARRIAFAHSNCLPSGCLGLGHIYVMNADGSGQTQLTNPGPRVHDFSPRWSPDGEKITFVRDDLDGSVDIYTMNPDGSAITRLTNTADVESNLDWQPLPGPQRSDYKNAAQFCKAERDFLGDAAFTKKYGGGANAHGKCVGQNH